MNNTKIYRNGLLQGGAVPAGRAKIGSGGLIQYGVPGTAFTAASTALLVINTDRYTPINVPYQVTLTELHFEVTAAPASNANVAIGVYLADSELQPLTRLYNVEVAVASGFTGVKDVTGLSIALPPGNYLIAKNCDVAMTLRSFPQAPAQTTGAKVLGGNQPHIPGQ